MFVRKVQEKLAHTHNIKIYFITENLSPKRTINPYTNGHVLGNICRSIHQAFSACVLPCPLIYLH